MLPLWSKLIYSRTGGKACQEPLPLQIRTFLFDILYLFSSSIFNLYVVFWKQHVGKLLASPLNSGESSKQSRLRWQHSEQ